ncbi:Bromodomain-containing 8 [Gossypium arboreum]|uniref:Bromodomain-containing 8 n=1 Tax=Gossypium arboreum TaxID=29729 RepID=A0A0B0MV76_GOSAR|nr:Bromodomain-containing 8 [Gossypium arboreum]
MAKPHSFPDKQTWGTWEELLLACAVHRYGNNSWDSVAMELQKRTSTFQHLFFTPLSCQQKFQDLKRRFAENDNDDGETTNNNNSTITVPWLDELRRLRVAELRREVQQYDLSIVSLQMKVQKLKEEREQSLTKNGKETEKSDLEREKGSEKKEENETENITRRPVNSREESERENHSVNESNSTDPKEESPGTVPDEAKDEPEPVEPDGGETGKEVQSVKPGGEASCNGSCDSVAKGSAENSERVDPRETGDSPESVAESKGEEPNRESSDVQSSASLSGKEKKNAEPDEPDNGELDQSPSIKKVSVESQPLVAFLEIFRSHKLGSFFERRLGSQKTPDYSNLIRQHLDLETIGMRVEEGWYSGCKSKFFRDLLLLLTNAIIFFGKESSEYAAAIEFRQLVSKEIGAQFRNSSVLPKEQSPSRVPESQMPLKPEPQLSLSLSMKPKLSVPLIACRKRSSIAAKSSTSSSGQEKKRQLLASLMNEKPALGWKQHDKSTEESPVAKKRTRESSASGSRKASKNAKARSNTNTSKNPGTNTNAAISSKGGSSNDNSESKGGEKEKSNSKTASSKKPSAANFLNRMRSSLSGNEPLTETLKGVITSDKGKGGGDAGEHKKNSASSKGDQQKDRTPTTRTRSGGKRTSPPKRSTGRPPKRVPATQSAPPGKRGREAVENHSGGGQAKKRSRK